MKSIREVSAELGISRQAVEKWVRKFNITKSKFGRTFLISDKDFQQIAQARGQVQPDAAEPATNEAQEIPEYPSHGIREMRLKEELKLGPQNLGRVFDLRNYRIMYYDLKEEGKWVHVQGHFSGVNIWLPEHLIETMTRL